MAKKKNVDNDAPEDPTPTVEQPPHDLSNAKPTSSAG